MSHPTSTKFTFFNRPRSTSRLGALIAAATVLVTSSLSATTIGYWRFEGDNFLQNSAGSGTLFSAGTAPTQYTLPGTGAGSDFPNPIPLTGASNLDGASFTGDGRLRPTDVTKGSFTSTRAMTFEAFFNPTTVGSEMALGSMWSGTTSFQTFRVTVNGDGNLTAGLRYSSSTILSSTLSVTAGTDYYTAVVYTGNATADVIFYMQDLTNGGPLQSQTISFDPDGVNTGNFPSSNNATEISLGSVAAGSYFNGIMDEVRISTTALSPSEFLITPIPEPGYYALFFGGAIFGVMLLRRRMRKA